MLKGKTQSGFEFEVPDESLNNYDMIEVLADVDANALLLPKLVKMLLGEEQAKRLTDHVRTDKGNVPLDAISVEIMEIFKSGQAKNS